MVMGFKVINWCFQIEFKIQIVELKNYSFFLYVDYCGKNWKLGVFDGWCGCIV